MENGKLAGTESLESIESGSTSSAISTRTASNIAGSEPVRTLFVSGLPMDAKQRELYLLFRSCRGYENSLLRITQSKDGGIASPVGFVTFSSVEDADIALKALQSVLFDPTTGHKIRLEKAKSNTKVSKPKQQISPPLAVLPPPTSVAAAAFPPCVLQAAAAAVAASAAPPPQSVFAPPPSIPASTSHRQDLLTAACISDPQLAHILNENHFLLNSMPQFAAAAAAAAAAASQPPFLLPSAAAAIAAGLPLPPVATANVSPAPFLQPNAAVAAQLTAATQHVTAAQLNAAAMSSANAVAKATTAASPACSTLFVANLGDGISEDELKAVSLLYTLSSILYFTDTRNNVVLPHALLIPVPPK
ncbi:unnamed protein product [Litomosoides sigmodontis]|uniref:RRM domain-containing protein n=1 Tax=Litomosoides sigmodontis TaxID=42156 RepID=A0A3P6TF20_LITSI|nr:unnamed protein product [Litomosoides sigmodontis]